MRRACPRRAWSFSGSGEITSGAFRSWGEHSSIVYRLLVARTGKSSAVGPDPDKNGVRGDEWASLPRRGLLARITSGYPVIRPELMSGAEIASYKPTSRDLSARCPTGLLPDCRQSGNYLAWQLESRRPVRPRLREAHLLGTRPRLLGRRVRRKGRTGNHSIPRGGPSAGRAGPICGLECSRRAWPLLRGAVVRPRARGDRSYRP
jgi:hypothetical protein